MRTIKVCAGIGDNVWLLQKLVSTGEQFIFELPDGQPQRGKQVFDLLPSIAAEARYVPGLNYQVLRKGNAQYDYARWHQIKQQGIYLTCNAWLEAGKPLASFFPDLPISYHLPYVIPKEDTKAVKKDFAMKKGEEVSLVGIYASAYGTTRAWKEFGAWSAREWCELITSIYIERPATVFVIMGAEWDNGMAKEILEHLRTCKIKAVSTVGKGLGYTLELMKLLTYAIYFPSGLPIMGESCMGACDCLMFYTTNIQKIMGTWADPARKADNRFKECLFTEPAKVYEWLRDEYKLFEKLL